MPVYDKGAMPLLEQLRAASDAEAVATSALLAYMQSGGTDNARMLELTNEMASAHENTMKIYGEMQKHRLDR